ncbi:hypothetical protein [Algirhabdus cladophorae]|uniref:hypothetical protein n=1 Tax=Algirhabdus cladophorae TaxID=3377108 RepID=UPI003B847266
MANHKGHRVQYDSFSDYLASLKSARPKGPLAMIFVEDNVEVASTIRHHISARFETILVFCPPEIEIPSALTGKVTIITDDAHRIHGIEPAINKMITAVPGIWMYYCYNGEYLFHPFNETRTVGEMLGFHTEERRDAMLTYVVDLYAGDLDAHPDAVSIPDAYLDKSGYYALARTDKWNNPIERQMDFFGGLRWRFEEHIPAPRRKIDRIGLFKSKQGLQMIPGHIFNDDEYNTFACPWHHNLTATICSFRTAKALKRNPGSKFDIDTFKWHNSAKFDWHSQQLLDLGLMEPGQWF